MASYTFASSHPLDPSSSTQPSPLRPPRPPHLQGYAGEHVDDDEDDAGDTFDPSSIDPELRLRTVKTAHSVIAESIRTEAAAEGRKRRRRMFGTMRRKMSGGSSLLKHRGRSMSQAPSLADSAKGADSGSMSMAIGPSELGIVPELPSSPVSSTHTSLPAAPAPLPPSSRSWWKGKARAPPTRRNIYINLPVPSAHTLPNGDPKIRYVRNKVRTSKYTILTFLPKNLFEQFRRVANIYFLAMVILPLFSIFGATNAQIGMLPLVFILGMTAIKDGIEDWRRAKLDGEVNNSATTRLGGWRNVNQPRDPREWYERLLGMGPNPNRPSKGVKKLRDLEAKKANELVQNSQKPAVGDDEEELSNVVVVDKETYPMGDMPGGLSVPDRLVRKSLSSASMTSKRSVGVMDWARPSPGTAQWERTLWKKLEVGDLVLLRDNDQVPADIIVLSTSNADHLCFVETKNLDGETNLKVRKSLKATSSITSEEDLEHAHFIVDSEPPHANLYAYNGVMRYANREAGGEVKQEAVTINELLLRGCSVRNTKWVIGLVVFTGADTKIMLNGGDTPSKRSKIEKETNFNVIMNFVILLVLCILTAILHGWYRSKTGTSADYYEIGGEASENIYLDSVIIFASCLIVFQNIVPISLYITIEIVKTIQAFFIYQDVEMYYEPYDTPCVPKSWNISDDLGQIEYVFSDKTGTLTQNIMEFKKCSIRGVSFGEGMTEAMMGAAKRQGLDIAMSMEEQDVRLAQLKQTMLESMKADINNRYLREDKLTLIDPTLPRHLADTSDPLRPHIISFFSALAICHTVLSDAPDSPFVLDYKAESPDEAALVAAARDVGFPFVQRKNSRIDIEVLGKAETWTPLRVLEFNSTRKRMSVIARDPTGRIVLFCKGADSVIYERLADSEDPELKAATLKDLETYANGGLRTLCISYRYLSEQEFTEWAQRYDAASAAVSDREAAIDRCCEEIEHSLLILGATALEDKLQEGVPDAIATLHQAGIKLWILTGDKLQTAIEIGYSCNLLTNDMEVMIISAESEDGARQQIEAGLNKMASTFGLPSSTGRPFAKRQKGISDPMREGGPRFAVVIDGDSLRYALDPSLKGLFLSLGTQCAAVICCRVSPSQKALTVRLVKEGCNAMTLSIGDGANDVAMIQEANVGVGLFGLEGSQAAMSADYAFGQFRFLTRLLLVHGRWSYVRIADMHANFFYKNIIWVIAMFWFLIFNSFDATYLFEYTFILFYNLIFTSLPVGILGAFDQDANATALLAFPQLYKRGIKGLEYTRTRFWLYMTDGLYQSVILFFIPYLIYGTGTTWSSDGTDTGSLYDLGTTIACAGVCAANVYVGINTRYWTFITWIVYVGSTLLVFLWVPIYSALSSFPYNGEVSIIYPTFTFWATIILTAFMCVGPRWFVSAFRQSYFPRDKDIVREAWVSGELKRQLGVRRRRDPPPPSPPAIVRTDPPGLVSTFQRVVSQGDSRGEYHAANITSPQRSYPGSPVMGSSSSMDQLDNPPRSPFSYPPPRSPAISSTLSPTSARRDSRPTVPPPLLLRHTSDPAQPSPTMHISGGRMDTTPPLTDLSYQSPSALDTHMLASSEIKRLSRTSIEIKRANMIDTDPRGVPHRTGSSRRSPREGPSPSAIPSIRRRSSAGPVMLGLAEETSSGMSPVQASFDVDRAHGEMFAPRSGAAASQDATSPWDGVGSEEMGVDDGYSNGGDGGYRAGGTGFAI